VIRERAPSDADADPEAPAAPIPHAEVSRLRVEVTVLRERVTALAVWAQDAARKMDSWGIPRQPGMAASVAASVAALQPNAIAAEVAARIARGESA